VGRDDLPAEIRKAHPRLTLASHQIAAPNLELEIHGSEIQAERGADPREVLVAEPLRTELLDVRPDMAPAPHHTDEPRGRQRFYSLNPDPLEEVGAWLHPFERFWRRRLRDMADLLESENEQ